MEIEAKFRVPNREAHRDLLRLRSIAGYTVDRLGKVDVVDRYFDTVDGRLLKAKYSCRLRTQKGQVIATLKGLGAAAGDAGAGGAVHRRDEREVVLDSLELNPAAWPPSDARQLALELTQGAPLQPLFDLNQSRAKANLMDGARLVGEWSLDEVRAVVGRRPAFYYELEIELGPDGLESDLARVAEALQGEHGLEPEPRSKFVRGLEMLRLRGAAVEGGLSDEEHAQLDGVCGRARSRTGPPGWGRAGMGGRAADAGDRDADRPFVRPRPLLAARIPRQAHGHFRAGGRPTASRHKQREVRPRPLPSRPALLRASPPGFHGCA